jgi:2'-5' RNA ligase
MRLFIAIPLSKNLKNRIIKMQKPVEGIKWQGRDQLHLTLRFLGEASSDRLSELSKQLGNIKQEPFSLNIKGTGVFPNLRSSQVIWAGVRKSKLLGDLYEAVEKQCQAVGFDAEKRPYKPHITLGRVKRAPGNDVRKLLKSSESEISSSEVVNGFNLYQSETLPEGAVHSIIEAYPLQG